MNTFLLSRRWCALREPLSLAALLTWLAIFVTLLLPRYGLQAIESSALVTVIVAMLAYLTALLIRLSSPQGDSNHWTSVLLIQLQVLAALVVLRVTGEGGVPALFVIIAVQVAHVSKPLSTWLMLINNVALLAVLLSMWRVTGALSAFVMYGGFQAFAWLTAFYACSAENSRDALREVNAELMATQSLLEDSARSHERLRLSRELHDVAGHKLTALKLQLAALTRDPAGAPPMLTTAARLADELLGDIRGVVSQMRYGDGLDIGRAIEELAAPLPRPRVHLSIEPDLRIDDIAQAQALLRAAQEALTNAARHSQAEQLWLSLQRSDGRIQLDIRDNGRGVAQLRSGNGLTGMRERLEDVGGGLQISGERGFRVLAWVPCT